MWSAIFWKDAFERAIKTAAQTAVVLMGTELTGFLDLDWGQIASVSGVAAVASLLTSVGSGYVGERDTASAIPTGPREPEQQFFEEN